MKSGHLFITIFAGGILLISAYLFLDDKEPVKPCEIDYIQVTSAYGFKYCKVHDKVNYRGEWNEPTNFERRHIRMNQ